MTDKCQYLKAIPAGDEVFYYCELNECACGAEYRNDACEEWEDGKLET